MFETIGLAKSFGNGHSRRPVLDGVYLRVAPGECVGLVGANGAGKTTLLSCLVGLLKPDQGRCLINGRTASSPEARRNVGYMPELASFDPASSATEILTYLGRLSGVSSKTLSTRIKSTLDHFGLSEPAGRVTRTYSRGMLQRLLFCQAIIHDPRCIVLDEPASNLDPSGTILLREELIERKHRGTAVLVSSHHLAELERIADRVFLLDRGTLHELDRERSLESHFAVVSS